MLEVSIVVLLLEVSRFFSIAFVLLCGFLNSFKFVRLYANGAGCIVWLVYLQITCYVFYLLIRIVSSQSLVVSSLVLCFNVDEHCAHNSLNGSGLFALCIVF